MYSIKQKIIAGFLSVLLIGTMAMSYFPLNLEVKADMDETGLCPHHVHHTADCGYVPPEICTHDPDICSDCLYYKARLEAYNQQMGISEGIQDEEQITEEELFGDEDENQESSEENSDETQNLEENGDENQSSADNNENQESSEDKNEDKQDSSDSNEEEKNNEEQESSGDIENNESSTENNEYEIDTSTEEVSDDNSSENNDEKSEISEINDEIPLTDDILELIDSDEIEYEEDIIDYADEELSLYALEEPVNTCEHVLQGCIVGEFCKSRFADPGKPCYNYEHCLICVDISKYISGYEVNFASTPGQGDPVVLQPVDGHDFYDLTDGMTVTSIDNHFSNWSNHVNDKNMIFPVNTYNGMKVEQDNGNTKVNFIYKNASEFYLSDTCANNFIAVVTSVQDCTKNNNGEYDDPKIYGGRYLYAVDNSDDNEYIITYAILSNHTHGTSFYYDGYFNLDDHGLNIGSAAHVNYVMSYSRKVRLSSNEIINELVEDYISDILHYPSPGDTYEVRIHHLSEGKVLKTIEGLDYVSYSCIQNTGRVLYDNELDDLIDHSLNLGTLYEEIPEERYLTDYNRRSSKYYFSPSLTGKSITLADSNSSPYLYVNSNNILNLYVDIGRSDGVSFTFSDNIVVDGSDSFTIPYVQESDDITASLCYYLGMSCNEVENFLKSKEWYNREYLYRYSIYTYLSFYTDSIRVNQYFIRYPSIVQDSDNLFCANFRWYNTRFGGYQYPECIYFKYTDDESLFKVISDQFSDYIIDFSERYSIPLWDGNILDHIYAGTNEMYKVSTYTVEELKSQQYFYYLPYTDLDSISEYTFRNNIVSANQTVEEKNMLITNTLYTSNISLVDNTTFIGAPFYFYETSNGSIVAVFDMKRDKNTTSGWELYSTSEYIGFFTGDGDSILPNSSYKIPLTAAYEDLKDKLQDNEWYCFVQIKNNGSTSMYTQYRYAYYTSYFRATEIPNIVIPGSSDTFTFKATMEAGWSVNGNFMETVEGLDPVLLDEFSVNITNITNIENINILINDKESGILSNSTSTSLNYDIQMVNGDKLEIIGLNDGCTVTFSVPSYFDIAKEPAYWTNIYSLSSTGVVSPISVYISNNPKITASDALNSIIDYEILDNGMIDYTFTLSLKQYRVAGSLSNKVVDFTNLDPVNEGMIVIKNAVSVDALSIVKDIAAQNHIKIESNVTEDFNTEITSGCINTSLFVLNSPGNFWNTTAFDVINCDYDTVRNTIGIELTNEMPIYQVYDRMSISTNIIQLDIEEKSMNLHEGSVSLFFDFKFTDLSGTEIDINDRISSGAPLNAGVFEKYFPSKYYNYSVDLRYIVTLTKDGVPLSNFTLDAYDRFIKTSQDFYNYYYNIAGQLTTNENGELWLYLGWGINDFGLTGIPLGTKINITVTASTPKGENSSYYEVVSEASTIVENYDLIDLNLQHSYRLRNDLVGTVAYIDTTIPSGWNSDIDEREGYRGVYWDYLGNDYRPVSGYMSNWYTSIEKRPASGIKVSYRNKLNSDLTITGTGITDENGNFNIDWVGENSTKDTIVPGLAVVPYSVTGNIESGYTYDSSHNQYVYLGGETITRKDDKELERFDRVATILLEKQVTDISTGYQILEGDLWANIIPKFNEGAPSSNSNDITHIFKCDISDGTVFLPSKIEIRDISTTRLVSTYTPDDYIMWNSGAFKITAPVNCYLKFPTLPNNYRIMRRFDYIDSSNKWTYGWTTWGDGIFLNSSYNLNLPVTVATTLLKFNAVDVLGAPYLQGLPSAKYLWSINKNGEIWLDIGPNGECVVNNGKISASEIKKIFTYWNFGDLYIDESLVSYEYMNSFITSSRINNDYIYGLCAIFEVKFIDENGNPYSYTYDENKVKVSTTTYADPPYKFSVAHYTTKPNNRNRLEGLDYTSCDFSSYGLQGLLHGHDVIKVEVPLDATYYYNGEYMDRWRTLSFALFNTYTAANSFTLGSAQTPSDATTTVTFFATTKDVLTTGVFVRKASYLGDTAANRRWYCMSDALINWIQTRKNAGEDTVTLYFIIDTTFKGFTHISFCDIPGFNVVPTSITQPYGIQYFGPISYRHANIEIVREGQLGPIAGSTLNLYYSLDNSSDNWIKLQEFDVNDKGTTFTLDNICINPGYYKISEETAPEGYNLVEDTVIKVERLYNSYTGYNCYNYYKYSAVSDYSTKYNNVFHKVETLPSDLELISSNMVDSASSGYDGVTVFNSDTVKIYFSLYSTKISESSPETVNFPDVGGEGFILTIYFGGTLVITMAIIFTYLLYIPKRKKK